MNGLASAVWNSRCMHAFCKREREREKKKHYCICPYIGEGGGGGGQEGKFVGEEYSVLLIKPYTHSAGVFVGRSHCTTSIQQNLNLQQT